jgi:hypothetical protein
MFKIVWDVDKLAWANLIAHIDVTHLSAIVKPRWETQIIPNTTKINIWCYQPFFFLFSSKLFYFKGKEWTSFLLEIRLTYLHLKDFATMNVNCTW